MADPSQLANQLHKELDKSGFLGVGGCDDDAVIALLRQAQGSMNQVIQSYSASFPGDDSLEDAIYDKLNEKHLKSALPLFYEVPDPRPVNPEGVDDPQWASRLFDAFHPSGLFNCTDEDALMLVLREANSAKQMGALDKLFHERYPDEDVLEESLYGELNGNELKAAMQLYYTGFGTSTKSDSSFVPVDGTLVPGTEKRMVIPLRLCDFNLDPYPEKEYRIESVDGAVVYSTGVTTGEGMIECIVPDSERKIKVILFVTKNETKEWSVAITSEFPPVSSIRGVLMRLHNLGYYENKPGEEWTVDEEVALRWFQQENQLENNGDWEHPETVETLKSIHGY